MSSNNLKNASSWIGSASGSLDSHDGADLSDGDAAITVTSSIISAHYLNASSGAAESSPAVISPDSNAGTKRWVLLGIRAATAQLTSGTSVNEFSTDGTLAGNSDDAIPTEKAVKTYVDNEISGVSALSNFGGYVDRPSFAYKDTDEIYINPGRYEHNGTSQQMAYWNSQLTFQFGPGGSNAGSSALAASDWYYLYIDDSAVVSLGAALLTAAEFVAVTTAPTYSVTKHGWYNGSDRCIGAFLTNASSQIVEFYHDGGEQVFFADEQGSITHTATSWTDVDLSDYVPGFSTKADVGFYTTYDAEDTATFGYWRTNGQTGSTGHRIGIAQDSGADTYRQINTTTVITDSSQVIECLMSNGDASLRIQISGWFFPRGM